MDSPADSKSNDVQDAKNGDTSDNEIEMVHGCFDFRLRTRSFDLHQIAQNQKIKKLSNLLRHNSVTSVKAPPKDSPPEASKSSRGSTPVPPAHRRRLVRVVRDSQCPDMENPFVVHKFSPEFFEQSNIERRSGSFSSGDKSTVLPYSVTGHTILKRQASECCDSDSLPQTPSPSVHKHASFQTDVIVIEFDKKSKVQKAKAFHSTHLEKLNDSYEFGCYNSNESHEDQLRFYDDYEKAVSKDSSGETSPESTSDSDSVFKSESESKESSTDMSNVKIESSPVTTLSDVKTNANSESNTTLSDVSTNSEFDVKPRSESITNGSDIKTESESTTNISDVKTESEPVTVESDVKAKTIAELDMKADVKKTEYVIDSKNDSWSKRETNPIDDTKSQTLKC